MTLFKKSFTINNVKGLYAYLLILIFLLQQYIPLFEYYNKSILVFKYLKYKEFFQILFLF